MPSKEARLAAAESAEELARFDAEQSANKELAPLTAVLLRSESASSSQIENLTSGARQVAVATLGESATKNAGLIAANVHAMEAALALSETLDAAAMIAMQEALLGDLAVRAWRSEQVWIGGHGAGPHMADFVPPHPDRVADAMSDLVAFMARDDLPVIVQAAVAHAQFETIHPFPDGNGRTGRALLHALLKGRGLVRSITVPVSAGLLTDTRGYFAALDAYRRGDLDAIVFALSDAVFAATSNGRWLLGELVTMRTNWTERLVARRDSVAWRLLDALPSQPVVNSAFVERNFGVSAVAALRALGQLEEASILREFTGKARSRMWVANEVTGVLDDFAARAGRRVSAG